MSRESLEEAKRTLRFIQEKIDKGQTLTREELALLAIRELITEGELK